MNLIRVIARKIFYLAMGRPLTAHEKCEKIIQEIRDGGGIVGDNVEILDSFIDMGEPNLIAIGSDVTLTGVRILTHDASTKRFLGYTKTGRVVIGSHVFIGNGVIILPDTVIGDNVIIGAGSVVAKDIPSNTVAAGNPIRILGSFEDYIEKNRQLMKEKPVLEEYPYQIMQHQESIDRLKESGTGYLL